MRKHLFGFGIFISIVAAAVFVYGFVYSPPISVVPAVDYPKDPRPNNLGRHKILKKIDYNVSAAELDIKNGVFRAQVDLEWNGKFPPPKSGFMNFYLMTANGDRKVSLSKTVRLNDPFIDGNKTGISVLLEDVDLSFARQENLYTFVEFSSDGDFAMRPEERASLARPTSVLLVHDGRAVRSEPVRSRR